MQAERCLWMVQERLEGGLNMDKFTRERWKVFWLLKAKEGTIILGVCGLIGLLWGFSTLSEKFRNIVLVVVLSLCMLALVGSVLFIWIYNNWEKAGEIVEGRRRK